MTLLPLAFISFDTFSNAKAEEHYPELAIDSSTFSLPCTIVEFANVPIGQTLEFLLFSEGEPTEIKSLSGDQYYFDYYYYRCSNSTYIVNTETGYICNASIGKFTGSCLP
jgi:hypothetical protein